MSSQRTITVIVSPEELRVFENAALESLRGELALPGFRRGNVPADIARGHIPQEQIFSEAVDRAVAQRGTAELEKLTEEVVGKPKIEITKMVPGNPLEFRMVVEVLPVVDVLRWRETSVVFSPQLVTDAAVEEAFGGLLRSRASFVPLGRPAQRGDVVEIDFTTKVDGVAVEGGSSRKHPFVLGEGRFVEGFEDALVGMNVGEEKKVAVTFPPDWPHAVLAGKPAECSITLRALRERVLPELNDAFARSVGKFHDLAALRENIQKGLLFEREEEERKRTRNTFLEELGRQIPEKSIPESAIAQEVKKLQDEFRHSVEHSGLLFEKYLKRLGKDENEFGKDFRETAIRRVKAGILLRAIARHENVMLDAQEIEVRAQETLKHLRSQENAGRIDTEALRSYTESTLRNEKVLEFIDAVIEKKEQ